MKSVFKKVAQSLLLVPAIVLGISAVTPLLSSGTAFAADVDSGVSGGVSSAQGTGQPADLFGDGGIFQTVTNVLLFLIGAVAVIMLIIGGLRYVVSAGDQSAVTGAKNTILYAVVGIVVAILAYAAVNFVTNQFVQN